MELLHEALLLVIPWCMIVILNIEGAVVWCVFLCESVFVSGNGCLHVSLCIGKSVLECVMSVREWECMPACDSVLR